MQARHFKAIAGAIAETVRVERACLKRAGDGPTAEDHAAIVVAIKGLAKDIARELGRFNDRFDRERFLEACGFTD